VKGGASIRSAIETVKAIFVRKRRSNIQSLDFENLTTIPRDSKYNHVALATFGTNPWRKEMPICPECDTDLDLDEEELDEGEIVSCPECGSDFEVITKHPLELNPVDDLDEDEEDDDADEDDEDSDY
jgi:alpha-aminoadipate carrier protein LysW